MVLFIYKKKIYYFLEMFFMYVNLLIWFEYKRKGNFNFIMFLENKLNYSLEFFFFNGIKIVCKEIVFNIWYLNFFIIIKEKKYDLIWE